MVSELLGEIAEVVMGQSPPGDTCNERGDGLPLLNGPTEFGLHHPTPVQFTADPRKRAMRGDILFCVRGSTTGRMNWADQEYAIGRGVAAIRHKKGLEFQPFLKALIDYRLQDLLAQATGSTFPNISHGQIVGLSCNVPSESEQRAIAHILGTLDDKIELNRRMNETLEAIARALFKSWFVDFDPVRAKAEGRDPCLPKHLADLFPDSFEDSELGEIPRGWAVASLGDLIELAYGKALKEENRQSGQIPVFGSNGQVGWHNEKLADGPAIIVGRKGNPGVVRWAPTDFFAIDTTFYVVPKAACRSLYFLFYALRDHRLDLLGADSAVPGLNRNIAYMSKQLVPSPAVLDEFDSRAGPLFRRGHRNDEQAGTLAAIRNTLLPKLISGELRVNGKEKVLEEAL